MDGYATSVAVVPIPSDTADTVVDQAAAMGVTWTGLGDVLVVRGRAAQMKQVLTGKGVTEPAHRSFVSEQRLHLVTQIGRLFQEDHPDIPVIVDKGRYLVVDLDPHAHSITDGPRASCYAIRPLPAETMVVAQRANGPRHREASAEPVLADGLSRAAFEADLGTLASRHTRNSASAGFLAALDWARNRLATLGYNTHIETVGLDAGTTHNLIADRTGEGDARDVVLLTAHLDSVNRQGPTAAAPGADDNASGSAGLITIGQALAHHASRHDLRLILFGGEEQGLFGSRRYVSELDATERGRISAVVNMDMIACRNTDSPTVLLEGAVASQAVIDALADAAQAHTSLTVQTSFNPFNSDHVPFLEQGIPAVLTIEGADGANDRVHTERDTFDSLDIDLALEILRMNVMFVARALGGGNL
jgi:peptidase M28-like protein